MVSDPLRVAKYAVRVQLPGPAAGAAVMNKIIEAERELRSITSALSKLKQSIQSKNQSNMADSVMDLRNWTLSFVESQAFLQSAVNPGDVANGTWHGQMSLLIGRAVDLGIARGRPFGGR